MDSPMMAMAPIVAVGALYVVAPVVAHTYQRLRGTKAVTCPETRQPADIEIDAAHAAAAAAFGRSELHVIRCSHWNERHYCAQECVAQLR